MTNTPLPSHLVLLRSDIIHAFREACAIHDQTDHFREGYFAYPLTQLLNQYFNLSEDS